MHACMHACKRTYLGKTISTATLFHSLLTREGFANSTKTIEEKIYVLHPLKLGNVILNETLRTVNVIQALFSSNVPRERSQIIQILSVW